ncbi:unnamed protein product [Protopolystoma xenopodis]|uniref:Uncharacterized protein n=1 Tax=Protopolystoma xenopodis TaxID=117903 RepID=A0A448XM41_9PLAT|nr:unnamed protein product [Protopolystoma xenopodis]
MIRGKKAEQDSPTFSDLSSGSVSSQITYREPGRSAGQVDNSLAPPQQTAATICCASGLVTPSNLEHTRHRTTSDQLISGPGHVVQTNKEGQAKSSWQRYQFYPTFSDPGCRLPRRAGIDVSGRCFARQTAATEVGFLWSWNHMLPKRWCGQVTDDDECLDHMLADFRRFCSAGVNNETCPCLSSSKTNDAEDRRLADFLDAFMVSPMARINLP